MRLIDLVGDTGVFLREYWQTRRPTLFKNQIVHGLWPDFHVENLQRWFVHDNVRAYRVEDGETSLYEIPLLADGSVDIAEVAKGYKEGITISIDRVHRHFEWARMMTSDLLVDFAYMGYIAVGMNVFVTPPNAQGLSRHVDHHQLFALQLDGTKRWLVGEDFEEYVLEAGDVMYIPTECAHEARTGIESSIHVGLGVYTERDLEKHEIANKKMYENAIREEV